MKKIYSIYLMAVVLVAVGCNDSFLEVYPEDQQTEVTAFVTDDNFKTFAWSLYSVFPGYSDTNFDDDKNAGYFMTKNTSITSALTSWETGNVVIPASGGGWDFTFVRRVNLMLSNIDKSQMDTEAKDHWRSVGYFFRAYYYMTLVSKFGDVPWVEGVLTTDSPELYDKRTPRDEVTGKMLEQLLWAESHIRVGGSGKNTINKNVVNAFISRFGLFEGTWRKYHGLGDSEKYLKASVDASEKIITALPEVNSQFDALFNSTNEKIATLSEVILYKEYREQASEGHSRVRAFRTGEANVECRKAFVDKFLCTDGRPISTSTVWEGKTEKDDSKKVYAEFRNRDRRLYLTVIPPLMTNDPRSGNFTSYNRYQPGDANYWADEFIELINSNTGSGWAGYKTLPPSNFKTMYASRIPNLWQSGNGTWNWFKTYCGYFPWKFYNEWVVCISNNSSNNSAAPIFRVGEVMLNYAEAAFELGTFNQALADRTINKLRARGGVKNMTVASIDEGWDTDRDSDVAPVLWEIRRERVMELSGEGLSFDDIRRWKKAEKQFSIAPLGAWVNKADYGANSSVKVATINDDGSVNYSASNTAGYVYAFEFKGIKGWQSYYYLYPIPSNQIALNPNLVQNEGYQ